MIFPSDDEREQDEARPEPKATHVPRQVTFWSLHTTASLLAHYHRLVAEACHNREAIKRGYLSEAATKLRQGWIDRDVDDLTAIVAELRARGHSVAEGE